MAARVGQKAPDFSAQALVGKEFQTITLSQYRGKWTLLFFYPLDFTFVCPTEISEFSKRKAEFDKIGTQILGCSVDSHFSHQAWTQGALGEISYPLLSDLTREIARQYGVLIEDKGFTLRGTFIIDPEMCIRYSQIGDTSVGRSVSELLRVLSAFQTGELCPVEWKPGQKTLNG